MSKKIVSYENSIRLLERKEQVREKLNELVYDGVCESIKAATSQVNKAVYEMAEKKGCSIWYICFTFYPEYSFVEPKFKIEGKEQSVIRAEGIVKLVPLELQLDKGPGYWKNKYLRLKEKMQELIDASKDE